MDNGDLDLVVRDPVRLGALRRLALVDSAPEESFDRITRLAAKLLSAPIVLVSLIDDDRQFFKSAVGLTEPLATERQTPLSHSFCQHAVAARTPLVIDDAREHPLVSNNPAITDLGVIAYAGIPLIGSDGQALGSFCAIDTRPHHWTEEELYILSELAAGVLTEIELRSALQAAGHSAEELRSAEKRFREALAHAAHDLKTPLTAIKGLAQLIVRQLTRYDTGEFAPAIDHARQIDSSASQMAVQLEKLQSDTRTPTFDPPEERRTEVDLGALVHHVVAEQQGANEHHQIVFHQEAREVLGWWDATLVERAIRNLIVNGIKYSPSGGEIIVTVTVSGASEYPIASVTVADHGLGIPAEDLSRIGERYFRARNVPPEVEGSGLGLSGVRRLAHSCGGALEIESEEGTGTTVTLLLAQNKRD